MAFSRREEKGACLRRVPTLTIVFVRKRIIRVLCDVHRIFGQFAGPEVVCELRARVSMPDLYVIDLGVVDVIKGRIHAIELLITRHIEAEIF